MKPSGPRDPNRPAMIEPGHFVVGCNYLASHAGTRMWSDWDRQVVSADLKQLAGAGMQVLRVFLLWPDFQPITNLYGYAGHVAEVRQGETPLGDDELGRAGLSPIALERFTTLADLAQRRGLKLIVGLVTGWMSGRMFVPPALQGRNVLTDPAAIRWQVRFVRTFVRRFKDHPAILAWDLGNECNCMGQVKSADEAWVWTAHIVSAIRMEDASHAVVSGMHSLSPGREAAWRLQDQAELCDVLTTHPYPAFTPHCDNDALNTIRSGLHATAESLFYEGVGRKPCFAEELGTLGPMHGSDEVAADYVRMVLFSLWAHGCHGMLWWCAYDQDRLAHAPYDWCSVERELGLFRADRRPKPVLAEMKRFAALLRRLPVRALPPRTTEAVCILSEDQDQWGAAYSSFVLAKQAQLDISFQFAGQPLKDSGLYLLPSMSGLNSFSRRFWLELLARVAAGATLYLSHDDCQLSLFCEPFGFEVLGRARRTAPASLLLDGLEGKPALMLPSRVKLILQPTHAAVLGREDDGNPVFTSAAYGKGRVFFLAVPLERELSNLPGCFHGPEAPPYWQIYRHIAEPMLRGRVARCLAPSLGTTEHTLPDGKRLLVLINYAPEPVQVPIALAPGWSVVETWYGAPLEKGVCRLGRNDAVLAVLGRERRTTRKL